MTLKIFRRGSARCIGLLSAFITILLCLYYISMGQPSTPPKDYHALGQSGKFESSHAKKHESFKLTLEKRENSSKFNRKTEWKHCSALQERPTNITTSNEFSRFEFQVCKLTSLFSKINILKYTFSLSGFEQKSIGTRRSKTSSKESSRTQGGLL